MSNVHLAPIIMLMLITLSGRATAQPGDAARGGIALALRVRAGDVLALERILLRCAAGILILALAK